MSQQISEFSRLNFTLSEKLNSAENEVYLCRSDLTDAHMNAESLKSRNEELSRDLKTLSESNSQKIELLNKKNEEAISQFHDKHQSVIKALTLDFDSQISLLKSTHYEELKNVLNTLDRSLNEQKTHQALYDRKVASLTGLMTCFQHAMGDHFSFSTTTAITKEFTKEQQSFEHPDSYQSNTQSCSSHVCLNPHSDENGHSLVEQETSLCIDAITGRVLAPCSPSTTICDCCHNSNSRPNKQLFNFASSSLTRAKESHPILAVLADSVHRAANALEALLPPHETPLPTSTANADPPCLAQLVSRLWGLMTSRCCIPIPVTACSSASFSSSTSCVMCADEKIRHLQDMLNMQTQRQQETLSVAVNELSTLLKAAESKFNSAIMKFTESLSTLILSSGEESANVYKVPVNPFSLAADSVAVLKDRLTSLDHQVCLWSRYTRSLEKISSLSDCDQMMHSSKILSDSFDPLRPVSSSKRRSGKLRNMPLCVHHASLLPSDDENCFEQSVSLLTESPFHSSPPPPLSEPSHYLSANRRKNETNSDCDDDAPTINSSNRPSFFSSQTASKKGEMKRENHFSSTDGMIPLRQALDSAYDERVGVCEVRPFTSPPPLSTQHAFFEQKERRTRMNSSPSSPSSTAQRRDFYLPMSQLRSSNPPFSPSRKSLHHRVNVFPFSSSSTFERVEFPSPPVFHHASRSNNYDNK
eukprot:GDKJ01038264.1.p1 GENE.GDKJ01038264.1~~GDKJ01038264.1.p1  ORF type:complete len:762 (-),score=195.61 GDKJ01038264.1:88-2187(-)